MNHGRITHRLDLWQWRYFIVLWKASFLLHVFLPTKCNLDLLKASGRAFCSGADMVTIHRLLQEGVILYFFYIVFFKWLFLLLICVWIMYRKWWSMQRVFQNIISIYIPFRNIFETECEYLTSFNLKAFNVSWLTIDYWPFNSWLSWMVSRWVAVQALRFLECSALQLTKLYAHYYYYHRYIAFRYILICLN